MYTLEEELLEIPLGGTAIGTSINAHKDYPDFVIERFRKVTRLDVRAAENRVQSQQSLGDFVALSGALRGLALELPDDPPVDAAHPARAETLAIPTGEVQVNGLAYIAAGPGAHPTVLLLHGLPGIEKNLDLAHTLRRHGWNVVTMNYRGSWGSPGSFSFKGNLEDARAALAWLRRPEVAASAMIR